MASAEDFVLNIRIPTSNVDAATSAVDKLGSALTAQTAFVKDLQGQLGNPNLSGKQFDALAAKVASASSKMRAMQEAQTKSDAKAAEAKIKLDEKMLRQSEKLAAQDENAASNNSMGGKLNGMIGAAEHATGVTGKLTAALRSLGPEGAAVAAVLTVVIAVVGAVVIAFRDMALAAISISQQKDALTATFAALAGGAKGADAVHASVAKLDAQLPQSKSLIEDWATSLLSAGIEGDKLESGIKAIASAAGMMPKTGAEASQRMIKQLAEGGEAAKGLMKQIQEGGKKSAALLADMGLQSKDLAAALGVTPEKLKTMTVSAEQMGAALEKALITKGKGALETMGLSWASISGKIHDGIESLFEDSTAFVAPFMQAVKSLFSEFSEGTTTMETAKSVIAAVLTEVFAVATKVVNFLHKGFLTVEIAAFKVAAAIWPIVSVLIALSKNETLMNGLILGFKAFAVVIGLVIGLGLALMATVGFFVGMFAAIGGAVLSMVATVAGALTWCVGDAARATGEIFATLGGWVSAAYDAASNFVSGIVNGISNGVGAVAAVKGLASSAMGAFTGFFRIKSPSGAMEDKAEEIPAGAVVGVNNGTGDLEDAMTDMGSAGMSGASKGFGKGGKGAASDSGSISVVVHYNGTREDNPDLETRLLDLLERVRGLAPRSAT